MRILVTGATGFIGKNLLPILEKHQVFGFGSKDYNLLDSNQCNKMFLDTNPEIVIHLAAKSGGILANKKYSAEYWYHNMLITGNIWEYSKDFNVKKLIVITPGCTYPANANVPVKEEDLWEGFPDLAPAPGALAKKMNTTASYAYKQQYGLNSSIIIPANCYGEHDVFDEINSHVIPAMIMKFHKAKIENKNEVTVWGTGSAIRDFIYVKDVVDCIPFFLENDIKFPSENPCIENICNISTETGTSIKQLAEAIKEVTEFKGEIVWDKTKPDGPKNKTFSNFRMKQLGLNFQTNLKEGLERTYEWYVKQLV